MKILSAASAVPETVVPNAELETRLGLEQGWIERRTGIRQRPVASREQATSDLAVTAGAEAFRRASVPTPDIGLVLLATSTPDHLLPPTAPLVAHRLGLARAGAVDLAGACSGFLYALVLGGAWADAMGKSVLVVGANVLTRRLNPADAATAALFSDGAGAVVIAPAMPSALLGSHLESDGAAYDAIGIAAGGSREPLSAEALREGRNLMTLRRGSALFKHAVRSMADAGAQAMAGAGIDSSQVDWWVPHQANARILQDTGALLGIPPQRTVSVVDRYGNSSAATIPIALAHAVDAGTLRRGNVLLLTAAGAGLISAGAVVRW
jgi:3-oxoacyl-[acyl-carrier-protein] synthase-3